MLNVRYFKHTYVKMYDRMVYFKGGRKNVFVF